MIWYIYIYTYCVHMYQQSTMVSTQKWWKYKRQARDKYFQFIPSGRTMPPLGTRSRLSQFLSIWILVRKQKKKKKTNNRQTLKKKTRFAEDFATLPKWTQVFVNFQTSKSRLGIPQPSRPLKRCPNVVRDPLLRPPGGLKEGCCWISVNSIPQVIWKK